MQLLNGETHFAGLRIREVIMPYVKALYKHLHVATNYLIEVTLQVLSRNKWQHMLVLKGVVTSLDTIHLGEKKGASVTFRGVAILLVSTFCLRSTLVACWESLKTSRDAETPLCFPF